MDLFACFVSVCRALFGYEGQTDVLKFVGKGGTNKIIGREGGAILLYRVC